MTVETLARRVRMEDLDLGQSFLASNGEEFVGFAFFGLRSRDVWCGGLGIVPKFRGRGLSKLLMSEFVARARCCGATRVRLEVLTRNTPAIRLYKQIGMRITRDLLILERVSGESGTTDRIVELHEADPDVMLRHYDRLHSWRLSWQRQLQSLLSADNIDAVCLGDRDKPDAYALLVTRPDGITQVIDLAAATVNDAEALAVGITWKFGAMRVVNEPEESPFIAALTRHGFAEVERQHEMLFEVSE